MIYGDQPATLTEEPPFCRHTEAELRRMFEKLREGHESQLARGKSLRIQISGRADPFERELSGLFSTPSSERDQLVRVRLFREHQAVPGNASEELCTLCHELGHWRSWARDERPAGYDLLVSMKGRETWNDLPESDRTAIFDEEIRAWRYGQAFAAEVGFSDWPEYEARARRDLATYCKELALPAELAASFTAGNL